MPVSADARLELRLDGQRLKHITLFKQFPKSIREPLGNAE
jgi:hypothetical protein